MGIEIYDPIEYFLNRPDSIEQLPYESGQLRYGDMCAAIGYSLGLESFEEVRNILGFRDEGKENHPLLGAKMQMDILWMARKRTPKHILEVGGGRGEICLALGYKKILSILIEPSKALDKLLDETCKMFNMGPIERSHVMIANFSIGDSTDLINGCSLVDTVILCESIEHIPQEEFDDVFTMSIKPMLQRNRGLLIITNWLTPFPIELELPWHVRVINDELYDWIAKDGETVYRNKNHLVVQF